MQSNGCSVFTEEQRMLDLLSSQKYVAGMYNSFCCEASTGAVRSCLFSILQDEHRIGEEIFSEMNVRGWYPTPKAEDRKLESAKSKFGQSVTV